MAYTFLFAPASWGKDGFLQIQNSYFWDPARQEYFLPRGIAYQIWNPPVGANQSFDQVAYDLLEFKKMYANSVRVEFVWSQVEIKDNQYDWSKPDFLVAKAEELGLRLFVIIGFQYPPAWFPKEWRGINDRVFTSTNEVDFRSDVLNYEHPEARRVYLEHITRVTERYKSSPAIGAWILGNEYAYFDLWEDPAKYPARRFLGYDPISQANFRKYLAASYRGNIATLNANWGSSYASFEAVGIPKRYPPDHRDPGYHDLIQWRKRSIGDFIALGAVAARRADPNHLQTYSMVGGIFNGNDANNTAEDGKTIVERCAAAGAPLDFWSVNNYAWASFGSELRSADFGIAKYQALTRLPIMISETGHSSTEDSLSDGAAERQPKAIPSTTWESLLSGALGVHLFHWNDRSQFTQGYFLRERGFGIVNQDRTPKNPVYENVLGMFRRMADIRIENLLGGSSNPPPDVQYFWSTNAEMVWPRANQENAMTWGALKRVGYQPGIIDDEQFERGAYSNAPALLLSRCTQMAPQHLDAILNEVLPHGIHVHANADLPGQFDAYYRPHPDWNARMSAIFGLATLTARPGFETSPTNGLPEYQVVQFKGAASFGPFTPSYTDHLESWKIWHGIRAASGTTIVTHTGVGATQSALPALQLKTHARAKAAVNTFALGDTFGSSSETHLWDIRYDWLRTIYRNHFGLLPVLELSGTDSAYKYVIPDYRLCRNGSVLISLLNEHTNTATVTLSAPALLSGRTVENLTSGGIVAANSSGNLRLSLSGDDYVLLYAYPSRDGRDESLINPSPVKLWFESAPTTIMALVGFGISLGYDIPSPTGLNLFFNLERVGPESRVYATADGNAVLKGKGTHMFRLRIPDADLNDPLYVSSRAGGHYAFHAWLERDGTRVSEAWLPVRLSLGVHPVAPPPTALVPRQSYQVAFEWDELPSFLPGDATPLGRAALWDSLRSTAQHYNIVLELRSANRVVATNTFLTRAGTGRHVFSGTVPPDAAGPFTWVARVETAPNVATHDVLDSFEGRDRGEDLPPFKPWFSYTYAELNSPRILSQGVVRQGSDAQPNHTAFLVVTNPPNSGTFSGFGLIRTLTNAWALPADKKLWTNYVFTFAYKEENRLPCVLEMQVKDTKRKWLEFTRPYQPDANGWDNIRASLADFIPSSAGEGFDPKAVIELALNIRMQRTNATYRALFDNVQYTGPPPVADDFEDRTPGEDYSRIVPWIGYGYDHAEHLDIKLNQGVGLPEASDGSQSAFVVAWNQVDSGDFAGFGMFYAFSREWSLPVDKTQWTNYSAAFAFKEQLGKPCVLEIQIKNKNETNAAGQVTQKGLHFTKPYTPGANGWDTIRATLDRFVQPNYFGAFDPSKVDTLVLNVQMLEKHPQTNVVYVGFFDDIRLDGPDTALPGGEVITSYTSENDLLRITGLSRTASGEWIVSWLGTAVLQSANDVTGPWTDVPNATNPQVVLPSASPRFYRLRR